jgi:3'-5' exoribonuclease
MKTYYVKDLQKGLVLTNESFAVKSVESAQTKDKKAYYKLILIDKTGEVKGQIWSDNFANIQKPALIPGNVIMINGTVDEYKGSLQINILTASKLDDNLLDEYMEASDFDLDELWEDLQKHIDSVKDPQISEFLKKLFTDKEISRRYKTYPAAEYVHHAFQGGLLEHVVEMLDLAQPLKKYYPEANYDFITAGIIMHDIGKLYELEPIGVVVQRTTEGYLEGHLVKSFEILLGKGRGILNEANMLLLKHIILAHHGFLEFGSPVLPATIEAVIVSYLDQLSTKARIFQKLIRKNMGNDQLFTEWDKLIGTRIYLGGVPPMEE